MEYKEYEARIVQKDEKGKPKSSFVTWRGDIILDIIKATRLTDFKKGDRYHIEIVPETSHFEHISVEEFEGEIQMNRRKPLHV